MFPRILLILVVFGLLYFLRYAFFTLLTANNCKNCKGLGYWEGTRGERNRCDNCNGTGKKK